MQLFRKRKQSVFGEIPDPYYAAGDMEYIRAYYDFRKAQGLDAFLIDDITWGDLDMDSVFKRINPSRCTSGEQYLYYMLRSPAVEKDSYESRQRMIQFVQEHPERRIQVERILTRLGCTRRADLCRAFYPEQHGIGMLLVYLALLFFLLSAVVMTTLYPSVGGKVPLCSLLINIYMHEFGRRRSQQDYDTVNYVVNMVFAMHRLRKLHDPELDKQLSTAYESLDRLRSVIRTGGVSTGMDSGGAADVILTVTLLDLITYEFLKNKLGCCQDDVFCIHECLGRLDAAISIASYRASVENYTEPEISFGENNAVYVFAEGVYHPLLQNAVPNDFVTNEPILITGSNASGKSTYLKAVALAVIMSQSICTVLAKHYRASAFRVYSSMALNDSIMLGESYYIAEIKSLKRIMDAASNDYPLLCVVDEVLRGTNTVERIAASCEILKTLAEKGNLCLAATHDTELCGPLYDTYRLFHFEERIVDDEMTFDYQLHSGKATSCNAIKLLSLMGFSIDVVERAQAHALEYLQTGIW